jgi:hypothetical protein
MIPTVQFGTICLITKVKIRTYKTIILPIVLYGCETWCHTSKKEHGMKVLEKKMLRISGPKKYDMIRGWRKLHNKELHNLYASPNVIGMIKESEIGRKCSTHTREEEYIWSVGGKARRK